MQDKETKDMGKCYRKVDNFRLYKDSMGFFGVYYCYKEEGKEYAMWRGMLAYPENFEAVIEDIRWEDRQLMKAAEIEFGVI